MEHFLTHSIHFEIRGLSESHLMIGVVSDSPSDNNYVVCVCVRACVWCVCVLGGAVGVSVGVSVGVGGMGMEDTEDTFITVK